MFNLGFRTDTKAFVLRVRGQDRADKPDFAYWSTDDRWTPFRERIRLFESESDADSVWQVYCMKRGYNPLHMTKLGVSIEKAESSDA